MTATFFIDATSPFPSCPVTASETAAVVSLAGSSPILLTCTATVERGRVAGGMSAVPDVPPRSIFALVGEQFRDYWDTGTWDEDL